MGGAHIDGMRVARSDCSRKQETMKMLRIEQWGDNPNEAERVWVVRMEPGVIGVREVRADGTLGPRIIADLTLSRVLQLLSDEVRIL